MFSSSILLGSALYIKAKNSKSFNKSLKGTSVCANEGKIDLRSMVTGGALSRLVLYQRRSSS